MKLKVLGESAEGGGEDNCGEGGPLIRGSISTHSPGYRIDGESGSLLRSNILFE
jgi:hypothetical protein